MGSPVITDVTRAVRTVEHPRRDTGALPNGTDRSLAERLERTVGAAGVRVELWDGTVLPTSPRHPLGDMIVDDQRELLGLIVNPDIWFGDAYLWTAARS